MQYLQLGNTDLNISRICLGCMTYGEWPVDVGVFGPGDTVALVGVVLMRHW